MHGPLSFGCNFSCKVRQDLAVGVAGDERSRRRFDSRWQRTVAVSGKFITVQPAGGSIADPARLRFFVPAKQIADDAIHKFHW